eukprot:CAMPEP_0194487724 /NCGR_PEP_ID=MMETSP0253-20130528/7911_1 /TAXON_ID=2966 /ORGANISM="Noctiluca scintillans" /LENGTH=77 /DNA_ID=CAMNT_0039327981 /DNA_START=620 /DNA_END=850 /DNA_ORIENTATION=+
MSFSDLANAALLDAAMSAVSAVMGRSSVPSGTDVSDSSGPLRKRTGSYSIANLPWFWPISEKALGVTTPTGHLIIRN